MGKKVSYKAESISEYIKTLQSIKDDFLKSDKDFEMYYRGEPKDYKDTSGIPGIARGNWLKEKNESELMRECERRLPNEFAECKSTFERLVKMQHYGIPTRVLDITLDPLVALFFALYKDPKNHDDLSKKNAVVLVYKVPKKQICNYRSDKVTIVSNISVYNFDNLDFEKVTFDEEGNPTDTYSHLLHEIKSEKPYFEPKINKDDLTNVYAVHPLLDNPRIRAQQGAFLLYGLEKNRHELAKLENSNIIKIKITIPGGSKEAMLKELILLGKTVDNIYPDWGGVSDFFSSFYKIDNFKDYYKSKLSKPKLSKPKLSKPKSSKPKSSKSKSSKPKSSKPKSSKPKSSEDSGVFSKEE